MMHLPSRTTDLSIRFPGAALTCLGIMGLVALFGAGCGPLPAEPRRTEPQESPAPKAAEETQGAEAEHKCEKLKPGAPRRKCFEREFEAADRELNAVYKKLRAKLPEAVRTDLKDNSRGWIRMKEYNCEFQSEMVQGATYEARRTEFFRCALDYTTDRTDYLRRAFGRKGVSSGVAGDYDDGFWGSLEFEAIAKKPGVYRFLIEVVRGPTAHIGEIEGEVAIKADGSGVYAERPECGGPPSDPASANPANTGPWGGQPCCRLDFRLRNQGGFHTIEVKETKCGYYHGARAYFDGLYRKVK